VIVKLCHRAKGGPHFLPACNNRLAKGEGDEALIPRLPRFSSPKEIKNRHTRMGRRWLASPTPSHALKRMCWVERIGVQAPPMNSPDYADQGSCFGRSAAGTTRAENV